MKKIVLALVVPALAFVAVPVAAHSTSLSCFGKAPTYIGTSGDDIVHTGEDTGDVIMTLGGNDTVYVSSGDEATATYVCTGDGNDKIYNTFAKINGGGGYDTAKVDVCWAQWPDPAIGAPKVMKVEDLTLTPCTMTK